MKMTTQFIPNLFSLKNLVIQDLKESALNIENSKISLVLGAIEASNISTSENGDLLNFVNNKNISIMNICCNNFDSTGRGIFLYISTPKTVHASLVSISSSFSPKSVFGIFSTDSNFTSLNISRIGRCSRPGLCNYGTDKGKSFVKFHTVAESHTNNVFVDESTYGEQMWTSINGVNCSCGTSDSIFKDFSANTVMKDGVFVGNWKTSKEKPLVILRQEGTLQLENVLVQGNGTVSGVSSGYVYSEDPRTVEMILGNQDHCRVSIREKKICTNLKFHRVINFIIMTLT